MPEFSGSALSEEDRKLVTLARSARARVGASDAGAVRDADGRSYASAAVALPSLRISGLDLAVAQAVSAGARGLEAAVVVSDSEPDAADLSSVRDLGGVGVPVYLADSAGAVRAEILT